MKRFLLILALSFSLPSVGQLFPEHPKTFIEHAGIIITYSYEFKSDSINLDHIGKEDMLLFLGKSVSKFVSKKSCLADTIMKRINTSEELQRMLSDPGRPLPMPSVLYEIYKNYPNDKMTFTGHTIDGSFRFQEDLNLFNWQLSGDTATINGYKAQKATCDFGGRSWIAWFCAEIPYSDGPYKFNGLPGLIVKAYDTRNHYVFTIKTIEKPVRERVIDIEEREYIETTKQGFFKAEDALRDDIVNRVKEAGAGSESQQAAARNMAARNNPIELKRK
jgi:GLPGLI family protein